MRNNPAPHGETPITAPASSGLNRRDRDQGTPPLAWQTGLVNLAARDVDQLAAIMKNRLKRIQYRPALIQAFLAQAGLTFDPQPP